MPGGSLRWLVGGDARDGWPHVAVGSAKTMHEYMR